jgi:hypothetical protein
VAKRRERDRLLRRIGINLGDRVLNAIVGTLVTLAVGGGTALVVRACDAGEGTPVGVDEVRARLVERGYRIAAFKRLRLHPGAVSYVIVGQRDALNASDGVWVYDETGGRLEERFALEPTIVAGESGRPASFRFELLASRDFDRDGLTDLVGAYTFHDPVASVRAPVTIGWDDARRRYRIAPVLAHPVPLAPFSTPRGSRRYQLPQRMRDTRAGVDFRAWGAETLVVDAAGRGIGLVGTYRLTRHDAPRQRFQVSAWVVVPGARKPTTSYVCFMGAARELPPQTAFGRRRGDATTFLVVTAPPGARPEALARRTWRALLRADRRARSGARQPGVYLGGGREPGKCLFGE